MIKKYRKDGDVSYALGATLVMELLNKKPSAAKCVYVSPKSSVDAVSKKAAELNVPVVESEKAFNVVGAKGNCYCIGVFDKFESSVSGGDHIVLVNPSDSGNVGTILRAAAAFDKCDVAIIRPAVDVFDPKTVRSSMGAIFDVNFELFDSFDEYLRLFPDRKIVPFMLDGKPFEAYRFDNGTAYSLVFGNEATGLDRSFSRFGAVRIKQSERVDSLNLSIAASVAMYKLYTEK